MTGFEQRILIFVPFGKDASLACEVLQKSSIACHLCNSFQDLLSELERGAGAVLTVEEALPESVSTRLSQYLASQPAWSDIPLLLLTRSGGNEAWSMRAYETLGNVTLLERPLRASTLTSAARSAIRARLRQYEIHAADERKDEFLAMLAHELRNPLAPISSAAMILELVAADPAKVKATSQVIARQVGHMTHLIDDLLDVARVTRGLITLEKKPHDIRDILSQAIEQVSPQILAKQQHIQLASAMEPAMVIGDDQRLIQVISNLLNNASKYTPELGRIDIYLKVQAEQIVLEVIDNGIGIAPEMVDQVFDLFAQAKRTSDRSQGGLGLGLALVKSLVTSHGGTVYATSGGPGLGSTFTLSLPRHQVVSTANVDEKKSDLLASPCESHRILLVDDNRDAADCLAIYLRTIGQNVSVAYSADSAIAIAREFAPEICILDIGLPEMDGYQLAAALRSLPDSADATYIAVTGYSADSFSGQTSADFAHYFVKPVDLRKLQSALSH
jgi:signal transduction histidine kinase/CheY-like chemotaxis protein